MILPRDLRYEWSDGTLAACMTVDLE